MRIPKLRRNGDGRAFVEHKSIPNRSKRMYLGKYGSTEAERQYDLFVNQLTSGVTADLHSAGGGPYTIGELVDLYLPFAEKHYAEDGEPTKEFLNMRDALRPLLELFGEQVAGSFGPRALTTLRNHLIRSGLARTTINSRIGRVRRFFKWCCQHEYLPGSVYANLATVDGLRRGQSNVKEAEPVRPVPECDVLAVLPFVAPQVAAMIQAQYLCGMRPGDVVIMRRSDLDMGGDIWLYEPYRHKGDWRGKILVKAVPARAQAILKPFFKPDLDTYLFSPRDADEWHRARRCKPNRRAPVYPSELRRRAKNRRRCSKRRIGEHYTTTSYWQAVQRGLEHAAAAGVEIPHWTPNQLRHSISTAIAKMSGLGQQAAQRWLGHAKLDTTSIYTEREVSELIEIARELDRRWAG